jgi:hypothetical protein
VGSVGSAPATPTGTSSGVSFEAEPSEDFFDFLADGEAVFTAFLGTALETGLLFLGFAFVADIGALFPLHQPEKR